LVSSVSPLGCVFIADRWGILSAFYFLAGTVFAANLIVMAIREEGKESPALVEERA
jgi:hypothetical protein